MSQERTLVRRGSVLLAVACAAVLALALGLSNLSSEVAYADDPAGFAAGQMDKQDASTVGGMKDAVTKDTSASTLSISIFAKKRIYPSNGKKGYNFKSSNPNIAKVNSKTGLVTPMMNGSTVISCKDAAGRIYKAKVKVTKPNIKCAWNGWKKSGDYFLDLFTLKNKSGKALKMIHSALYWNSWEQNVTLYNTSGHVLSSSNPLKIKKGKAGKFITATKSAYNMTDTTQVWFWVTVGSQDYRVCFCPKAKGKLVGIMRD